MRGCRRHEPADPQCPTCTGRAARRIGRAILATNPRRLFAVTFDTTLSGNQFRSWRTAVRNLVDHQRRECRWWRQVAMQVWLGADGRLRGVVSLDAVTTDEFRDAFRRLVGVHNERQGWRSGGCGLRSSGAGCGRPFRRTDRAGGEIHIEAAEGHITLEEGGLLRVASIAP